MNITEGLAPTVIRTKRTSMSQWQHLQLLTQPEHPSSAEGAAQPQGPSLLHLGRDVGTPCCWQWQWFVTLKEKLNSP